MVWKTILSFWEGSFSGVNMVNCLMFMVSTQFLRQIVAGAWLMGELAGNHAERARLASR